MLPSTTASVPPLAWFPMSMFHAQLGTAPYRERFCRRSAGFDPDAFTRWQAAD